MNLLDTALAWHAAGVSIVPTRTDGSKAPAAFWKQYQDTPATIEQLTTWFTSGDHDGMGAVCGPVSGHLEMLEWEGRAAHLVTEFARALTDNGLDHLWQQLTVHGRVEHTPSGGTHLYYRVNGDSEPNTRLARRPSTPEELDHWKTLERAKADQITDPDMRARRLAKIDATLPHQVPQVLIETRGAGGFTVLAPSAGRTHPTGQAWTAITGQPGQIPTISVDDRDLLYAIASSFDQMPDPDTLPDDRPTGAGTTPHDDGSVRPGDDYNTRASWDDILTPHGWTKTKRIGTGYGWTRPGKSGADGISATTGQNEHDRLYVFTTSTQFDADRPYSKFAAYALLEHNGDYAAAAKQLHTDGYGQHATRLTPTEPDNLFDGLPTESDTPWTNASAEKATAPTATAKAASPAEDPAPAPAPSTTSPATTPTSDRDAEPIQDNTALLLVDHHAHEIRFCPGRNTWLTWNGHRWVNDDRGHVRELTRAIARRLPEGEGWTAYRKSALTSNGVTGILNLAATDPRIVAPIDQLDARPYELNTPAGVVDLRTGIISNPNPEALHTRSTTVSPNPDHPHPLWDRFLADTFAGDPDMTSYVQRLLGVSLLGCVLEQIFPFAFGSGANGKTTLLSVAQHLIGMGPTGYAMSAPASMLLASKNDAHPTELARLSGARLVVTSELEDDQRFAEAKIKLLTGKDTISGRFMRQDWFDFTPTHTLWLLANHQPEVRAGGEAFWRRIRMLPFLHTVPEGARIPDLEDKLIEQEGPGILAWMIQGAADYFTHGLTEPATVTLATAAYQREQDSLARFVDECCQLGPIADPNMLIASHELRRAYEKWCLQEGEEPRTQKAMTTALKSRFDVLPTRTAALRILKGIRLNDPEPDASSDASSTDGRADFDPTDRGGW